jgi:predicted AAA+ superfamily ATPase
MERHAMQALIAWKNNKNRKPLILQGARQVGKTWLMKEFGKTQFKKYAYFIFEKNEKLQSIFKGDLKTNRILESLEILAGLLSLMKFKNALTQSLSLNILMRNFRSIRLLQPAVC